MCLDYLDSNKERQETFRRRARTNKIIYVSGLTECNSVSAPRLFTKYFKFWSVFWVNGVDWDVGSMNFVRS